VEARVLSYRQAKAFYDGLGKKQDWQSFYEDVAIEALIRNGQFDRASGVLELGCGTGRFAERLLEKHLPPNARYIGVDISETMVALAKERLVRFGSRAELRLTESSPQLDFETGAFDRFVSNYVFAIRIRGHPGTPSRSVASLVRRRAFGISEPHSWIYLHFSGRGKHLDDDLCDSTDVCWRMPTD
jgi:SAM-dependent methyltransferase